MTSSSPTATPKRKWVDDPALSSPVKFSFEFAEPDISADEAGSPRSKVAHRFRGLALGSGGGVPHDHGDDDDGTMDALRKRQKSNEAMIAAGEVCYQHQNKHASSPRAPDSRPHVAFKTHAAAADIALKPSLLPDEAERSNIESPPRSTPPFELENESTGADETKTLQGQNADGLEEDDDVVDPIRAALTWHEDEITVYDPEDADDDGTGVNGIGFKPTPALARARAMRRRQQMADYRKREEGEARTKRNQRRRGEERLSERSKKKSPARRVHFLDPERRHTALVTQ